MTQPPVAQSVPYVTPEELEEAIRELVPLAWETLKEAVHDIMPDYQIHGMVPIKGHSAELESFISRTVIDDLPYLIDVSDYVDRYKEGRAPPLQSPYWLGLLSWPEAFEHERKRFKQLWKEEIEDKRGEA